MFPLFRTFISVYETRNFTHTAEKLYLSQPTISSQIRKLEEHLGVQLFLRSGKQEITPTQEADFLYPRILLILEEWADTRRHLLEKEDFRESCVIGCSHTCAVYFVPRLMPALIQAFPQVDFTLTTMNSEEVLQQLLQKKADLGFIEKPVRHEQLEFRNIYQDQLVLAGVATAPYWLLRENESGLHFYNEHYLEQENLNPHLIHVNNNEAILALLKAGVGQSIISQLAITDAIPWRPLQGESTRAFYLANQETVFRPIVTEIASFIEELVPTIDFKGELMP